MLKLFFKNYVNGFMLALITFVIMMLLMGCRGDSITQVQQGDFKVEFLFENDGIKVYRFFDGGRPVYFTNVEGRVQYDYSTGGKHSHRVPAETICN